MTSEDKDPDEIDQLAMLATGSILEGEDALMVQKQLQGSPGAFGLRLALAYLELYDVEGAKAVLRSMLAD